MNALQLTNLSKSFNQNNVLNQDHWHIESGTYWIKGGNGSGKTTLFKILAGQIPFTGEVNLNQISQRKEPTRYRKLISYAPADPQYPTFISGNDLVAYFASVRKVSIQSADLLIDTFRLRDFIHHKIETYSTGMLKKLSLVCAFTGNASLFLLDEPFIAIDASAADELCNQISRLKTEQKIVLISSHQKLDHTKVVLNKTFSIVEKKIQSC